jgi:hypothetical protein
MILTYIQTDLCQENDPVILATACHKFCSSPNPEDARNGGQGKESAAEIDQQSGITINDHLSWRSEEYGHGAIPLDVSRKSMECAARKYRRMREAYIVMHGP